MSDGKQQDNQLSPFGIARSTVKGEPLSKDELEKYTQYFNATMYIALGMIYLRRNPLLKEPLTLDHIKARLLGHFGSAPGQSFTYLHFNRLILKYDLNAFYISGPGHGAPGIISHSFLEGTYSEVYPDVTPDARGLQILFRNFSHPGGNGSHATPEVPGSLHEGGELGYSISHAFGTVFDRPDLIALTMVGDGESETGPLATAWHSNKFLNPITDGAVLPVLHLNGYKINNPTVLARVSHEELECLFKGYGWTPYFVEGSDLNSMHQAMAATLEKCVIEIREYQKKARDSGKAFRPRWPMIVLRSPKGWTGPGEVGGHHLEGFWRAHQVPITDVAKNDDHLKLLERWMKSYEPEKVFDEEGKLIPELRALAPQGTRRMSANPVTNGGFPNKPLVLPRWEDYCMKIEPGVTLESGMQNMAIWLRDVVAKNYTNFRLFGPDETESNKLSEVYKAGKKVWMGEMLDYDQDGGNLSMEGRVMEMLSEHTVEGWLEGYLLAGGHGLLNSYEPFIHIIDSMVGQHAKWLEKCKEVEWRKPVNSLNILLTSTVWRQDHNGFTHQDPGFIDVLANKSPEIVRIYFPADGNTFLSTVDHCFRSKNYVNTIVYDKQPHLQFLNMEDAKTHCAKGLGIWEWASVNPTEAPDVVMCGIGDIVTAEALAATALLKEYLPWINIRFVNVVDLFRLVSKDDHPHGLSDKQFDSVFTTDKPVVVAFHSYPHMIHRLTYRRAGSRNIHVRGYREKGNIDTPLELAIRNGCSRFDLAIEAIDQMNLGNRGSVVREKLEDEKIRAKAYAFEHGTDVPNLDAWHWKADTARVKTDHKGTGKEPAAGTEVRETD